MDSIITEEKARDYFDSLQDEEQGLGPAEWVPMLRAYLAEHLFTPGGEQFVREQIKVLESLLPTPTKEG